MKLTTHQVLLSPEEFDELYRLADLPRTENKSVALRAVLRGYDDQITENNNLKQHLKQISDNHTNKLIKVWDEGFNIG